jgi:hypothetical protein
MEKWNGIEKLSRTTPSLFGSKVVLGDHHYIKKKFLEMGKIIFLRTGAVPFLFLLTTKDSYL